MVFTNVMFLKYVTTFFTLPHHVSQPVNMANATVPKHWELKQSNHGIHILRTLYLETNNISIQYQLFEMYTFSFLDSNLITNV